MKGLDLKRFKKIRVDKDRSVFKDGAGHEMHVAHAPLSPARRKQLDAIPTYAEGGMVEDDGEELPERAIASGKKFGIGEDTLKAIRQFEVPESQQSPQEAMGPVKPEPSGLMEKTDEALSEAFPGARDHLARVEWERSNKGNIPVSELSQAVQGPKPASIAPAQVAPEMPTSVAPNQSAASLSGLGQQFQQGAQAEAQAIGEQAKAESAVLDESVKAQQELMQSFQEKSQAAMNEINAVMEDYKKQHINPNAYLESRTSGQKVMTAIGLILGGIGSGLAGGPNPAEKFLEDQIARDIKAQEAEIGKRETLLGFNFKQLGNMNDAITMTNAMQKGIYAAKLEQAAVGAKSPIAQARAMQLAAKFKAEILPDISKLAESQASLGILNNPNASPLAKIHALPKEMRDNALKELNDYKSIQTQLAQVGPVLREAFKNTSLGEKALNPIQSSQRQKVAFAQLFPIAKAIAGERMTDADAKALIEPYLPGFTTNKTTLEQNIKKLEDQLASAASGKTPILSQYVIVPKLSSTPERKKMGGVEYEKVPGGWKKVK